MAESVKKRDRGLSTQSSKKPPSRKPKGKPTNKRSAKPHAQTKQSRAIALLHSRKGATLDALMKVTGWQRHSVRGFLAGVVRKRLKLSFNSEVAKGRRVYRIIEGTAQATSRGVAEERQS